jgi:hypothetical protein
MTFQDRAELQTDAPPPPETENRIAVMPCVLCAALSEGLIRGGFPGFFFLAPLGFIAYGYNIRSAWVCAGGAVLLHGLFSVGLTVFTDALKISWMDLLYIILTLAIFTWITAPPRGVRFSFLRIPLAYRFIAGSVLGTLTFFGTVKGGQASFDAFLRSQSETLSSLYIASAGTDVVRRSLLEEQATPDMIMELLTLVMFRGGGVASCILMFFVSRQISLLFVRLIRRITIPEQISRFYTPPNLIWALSFSLLGVVLARYMSFSFLEIAGWNMVTICAILYLAQGWGIVWYFLSRQDLPPLLRLLLTIVLFALIFSPGINLIVLGLLILLGIIEQWAPFRASNSDGSSSTPGM